MTNDEENEVARLIRAGLSPDARPGAEARAQAWRRLAAELRATRAAGFPDRWLALLAGELLLMVVWLFARPAGTADAAAAVATALVVINLVMVPIAGIVIVLRRRHV